MELMELTEESLFKSVDGMETSCRMYYKVNLVLEELQDSDYQKKKFAEK